jgi:hypothetical protein
MAAPLETLDDRSRSILAEEGCGCNYLEMLSTRRRGRAEGAEDERLTQG